MNLSELGIDEQEMARVINAALDRVAPDYADARLTGCSVNELERPNGRTAPVVLLRIDARYLREARGQYHPLSASHDRGFVDEYLYGVVHGHWLARHGRDLFDEIHLVIDVHADEESRPLYRYVDVAEATRDSLLPAGSPLAEAVERYSVRRLPQVGSWLGGPSPGMMGAVAAEVAARDCPRFLDAFSGSCALARVALEHGAIEAVCVDPALDEDVARENLSEYAPSVDLRRGPIEAELRDGEFFAVAALDPFYDQTLASLRSALPMLRKRAGRVVINLGPALPTVWQDRILRFVEGSVSAVDVTISHGERIAVCQNEAGC